MTTKAGFASLLQGVNQVVKLLAKVEEAFNPLERITMRLIGLSFLVHHFLLRHI
jgi:hypothetical protein